eukprot:6348250-Prorocentrum_lima.AAC.1
MPPATEEHCRCDAAQSGPSGASCMDAPSLALRRFLVGLPMMRATPQQQAWAALRRPPPADWPATLLCW